MFRRFPFIATCVLCFSLVSIGFRNLHEYYNIRSDEARRAKLYLQDICSNGALVERLGSFAECESKRKIINITPVMRAWYDFSEDLYVCGHGRCQVFWTEVSAKLPYILFFTSMIAIYMMYLTIQNNNIQTASMMYQLPLMNPRLMGRHSHVD